MKVVHLNTYDGNGGAGRAVLRLNRSLNLAGVDSKVVCLYQFNAASGVISLSKDFLNKIRAIFNIMAERYFVRFFQRDNSIPFSLQRFGISVLDLQLLKECDIIHIHWINHGFLAPSNIASLAQLNKKIVWTVHDSNPITGGCHVRYGCDNYKQACGNCPVLGGDDAQDLSNRTWQMKKYAYSKLNFEFIGVSKWMADRTKEASLAKGKQVTVISNALETEIFVPVDKLQCRKEFNIKEDAHVILAGFMPSKSDRHKGFPQLLETIKKLCECAELDKKKILLLFYGNETPVGFQLPVDYRFLGKVTNDELLVKLYNLADVFLFPSIEESMGYTALESLSCGTPVAAFDTSGVTDVVVHKHNGYLAKLYDTTDLAAGVLWILRNKQLHNLSFNSRMWAVTHFSMNVIGQKHIQLYERLVNEGDAQWV